MKPVKNRAGVILNAAVLRASQVVGMKVHCPACGEKTFERWPEGWETHAADRCAALESESIDERKAEFQRELGHLFETP